MNNRIISKTLKPDILDITFQPMIKRIMHEQVCQQWANNSPLWRSFYARTLLTFIFNRSLKPTFDVQQYPRFPDVMFHCSHDEFMIQIIEKTFDIQINDPFSIIKSVASSVFELTPTPDALSG